MQEERNKDKNDNNLKFSENAVEVFITYSCKIFSCNVNLILSEIFARHKSL